VEWRWRAAELSGRGGRLVTRHRQLVSKDPKRRAYSSLPNAGTYMPLRHQPTYRGASCACWVRFVRRNGGKRSWTGPDGAPAGGKRYDCRARCPVGWLKFLTGLSFSHAPHKWLLDSKVNFPRYSAGTCIDSSTRIVSRTHSPHLHIYRKTACLI
jgi:hypothetical protein